MHEPSVEIQGKITNTYNDNKVIRQDQPKKKVAKKKKKVIIKLETSRYEKN
jgi:hypothetical protein